jgi:ubiquinone/menaquinone biosynthesis C-methylase UbiE
MISRVAHAIVAKPLVYDAVQRLAGLDISLARLRPHLAEMAGHSVLDIGGGTGIFLPAFPADVSYIWLDIDQEKLNGFRARAGHLPALLGDGTRIGLADKSVDYGTCIAIAHHLTDTQLDQFVDEAARVVRKRIILLDPLDSDAWQSKLLWRYDRGSYPRTAERLQSAIARRFRIRQIETYAIYHRYALIVADTL